MALDFVNLTNQPEAVVNNTKEGAGGQCRCNIYVPGLCLLPELAVDGGVVLADLGYDGPRLAELLAEQNELLLITRRDVHEKRELHSSVRQGIETLLSWNSIKLKLLSYNLRLCGIVSA